LKCKYSMMAVATAVIVGGAIVTPMAAQAALPSITIWVDAPRLPGAKLYQTIMKGKVNVKVELHAQGDLLAKVQLFNRVKKGWPDVVFGAPNDVAVLKNPIINDAMALDKLASTSFWKGFGKANNWCKGSDGKTYCVKNDLAQTVLWYDVKLFKDFGYAVPKTMAAFVAIGKDLAAKHPGYSLGALGNGAAYADYLWPSQCPLNQEKSANRVVINPKSPKCTRVATMLQPLIDSGVLDTRSPFDAGYMKDVAQAGKLVAEIGPSWWGEFVLRPASSFKVPAGRIATAPMPMWPGEKINYSGEWGGGIYTVSPHSKYPKDALNFAIFMVSDKRNLVTVANPDGSHGAPTFPAYGPGNALWKTKVSSDKYYAKDPFPAMLVQSQRIFPGEKPVRFDSTSAMAGTYSNELQKSKNLTSALAAYATYVTNLARQLGYQVSTK
jgi:ABC-type glycerol-3-phosphate transport system substrate-binding protein